VLAEPDASLVRPRARARSHCRFVLPLIHFIPESLTYSVPLFLKRLCDRSLPHARRAAAAAAGSPTARGGAQVPVSLEGLYAVSAVEATADYPPFAKKVVACGLTFFGMVRRAACRLPWGRPALNLGGAVGCVRLCIRLCIRLCTRLCTRLCIRRCTPGRVEGGAADLHPPPRPMWMTPSWPRSRRPRGAA
jgi:hypothetical protein